MAMINCPECGKEISAKANKCPYCGWAKKKKSHFGLLIFIMLIITIGLAAAYFFGKNDGELEHLKKMWHEKLA